MPEGAMKALAQIFFTGLVRPKQIYIRRRVNRIILLRLTLVYMHFAEFGQGRKESLFVTAAVTIELIERIGGDSRR
jgi:hypothetical protein